MQCENAGVDAIGYQETRAMHAYDKVYKGKWWMCSSGQPAGNSCGGCGLWINLESVWATRGEATASPIEDAIHICHCEPKLLVVKMILVTVRIVFVVPHAPHSGRPKEEVAAYWKNLVAVVLGIMREGDEMVMMADANAHLHSDHIEEAAHAEHFVNALQALGACPKLGDEELATFWWSETGFVQDDYIATSKGVAPCHGGAEILWIMHVVEGGQHEAVAMDVTVEAGGGGYMRSRRKLDFDKAELRDPSVVAHLKRALSEIPLPGRNIEQESRAQYVAEAVRDVLQSVAPNAQREAKQHWISEHSLKIIEVRDDIRRTQDGC